MNIAIATSIRYNKQYRHLLPKSNEIKDLIEQYREHLIKEFDAVPTVLINIRPIGSRGIFGTMTGRTVKWGHGIEIDPRHTRDIVLNTVAHELTHSEQYHQKRLTWDSDNCVRLWNGCEYQLENCSKKSKAFEHYYNLPWEVEARERADQFIKKYFREKNSN